MLHLSCGDFYACFFHVILSLVSGSFLTCMFWLILRWRLREVGLSADFSFLSQQLSLLLYSALWTPDTLIFPNSQVHLFNSGTLLGSPWLSLPYALVWKLCPGIILGDHKLTSFVSPLSEIIVLCCLLSNIWKLMIYILSTLSFLRQKGKSSTPLPLFF